MKYKMKNGLKGNFRRDRIYVHTSAVKWQNSVATDHHTQDTQ